MAISGVTRLYQRYRTRFAVVDAVRCPYCVDFERTLPIYVLSRPTGSIFPRLWPSVKHYD